MQNLKLLAGTIVGTLVLVFAVAFLFSGDSDQSQNQTADAALTQGDRRNLKIAEATSDGDSETPMPSPETESQATDSASEPNEVVTIVEFSDFQCPACKAAEPVVEQVVEDNPGRVELIYRHFPLESIHPNARDAAIASEIAAEAGLFWEYHDLLFENQTEWADAEDPIAFFEQYAQELEIDTTDFSQKMESSVYSDLVEADIRDGFALGINATPTIYVNGVKVNNAGEVAAAVAAQL